MCLLTERVLKTKIMSEVNDEKTDRLGASLMKLSRVSITCTVFQKIDIPAYIWPAAVFIRNSRFLSVSPTRS